MNDTTSTPGSTAPEPSARRCCLCGAEGPEVAIAGTAERPSGPAIEYWACPACAPTVALLC
ncbi:hypothetical protein Kpho01_32430 [Kitasatospora phosalacinea]|uniref:Uncharacterized protein n=1 Tax=Kitasatospora phosalacinea TaxID=2065 RepID=A0A9W6PI22_9ACTN|nr:hypothetical protein Kpho01_32430 [Kitasatospora phosalacinea]